MGIHEECGVFGVLSAKKKMWRSWSITGSMPCSTEGRKAVGSWLMTMESFPLTRTWDW